MTDTSSTINFQSKYDLLRHVAKVKAGMSAHFMVDITPSFLAYLIFPLNPTLRENQKKIYFTHNNENKSCKTKRKYISHTIKKTISVTFLEY